MNGMEHKVICARYCIDVIRAVMWEQDVPEMPGEISLQELFEYARGQSVEAMVFHGLCQLDIAQDDPVWLHWENRAEMLLTQSIVQLAHRDELFDLLTEAGVDMLPLKGSWLKEAYPQVDFRQMSDLDILIHGKDRRKVGQLMESAGYTKEEQHAAHHDGYEKKPYTAVEIHLQMMNGSDKYHRYYDNVWEKVKTVDGNPRLFRLTPEDEYIYYILHLKHHLELAGCGIRLLLDSVVYRNLYPDMDPVYLQKEYEKLGIGTFVNQIQQIADCWFVSGTPIPEDLEELTRYILWSGIYGSFDTAVQIKMDALDRKYKNPLMRTLAYCCYHFCRPLSEMKGYYPVLEKCPVLLPVFWCVRLVSILKKRPGTLRQHFRSVRRKGEENG